MFLISISAQPPVVPSPPVPTDWQMIGSFADWTTVCVAVLAFIAAALAARATLQTNRAQQETLELQQKQ